MKNYYEEYIKERKQSGLPLPPKDKNSDEYKKFVMEEIKSGRGLPPIETKGEY